MRSRTNSPSFADFVEEWMLGQRLRLRPSTWRSYESVVRTYLVPAFGDLPLTEITTATVNGLYADLMAGGGKRLGRLTVNTLRHIHLVLTRVLDGATLQGLIERNPTWGSALPRQDRSFRPTVWTAAEAAEFLEFVDSHPHRALYHLALGTGLRRGELLGLSWDAVGADATLTVSRTLAYVDGAFDVFPPKARRSRTLALDGHTMLQLERHRLWEVLKGRPSAPTAAWDLVFTGAAREPLQPDRVTHEFRVLVKASGLPRIRFHDMRHTHATLLLASGVPLYVVSARLGHSFMTTFTQYAHVLPATDAAAANVYARALAGDDLPAFGRAQEATAFAGRGQLWQMRKVAASRGGTARRLRRAEATAWY